MFTLHRTIALKETDATGVLFFAEQHSIGLEAFEQFFSAQGIDIHSLMREEKFYLPIVHSEADFKNPLRAGDRVRVQLFLERLGTTSFTLCTEISKGLVLTGTTKIVHVCVTQKSMEPISLPQVLLNSLDGLVRNAG